MNTFPSQKSYEKVELFLRRHWLVLFFIYFGSGILILLGLAGFYLADKFFILEGNGLDLGLFLLGFYFLFIWYFLFKALTDFYLDTWIVTDHRILEIHQLGLFKRDVSELRLSKIQDVTVKVEGLLPTFFNYGEVIIQTAAEIPEFKFEQIPSPQKVKDEILQLYDRFIKQHPSDEEIHEL
ncbi:MAG: PH domain-containing protein [Parcubacteria group bacterium]|nr:PH domain-containing protein [Parcubacteria group bacterium]